MSTPGMIPARIIASGLRLVSVDRTQQFSPWVDSAHDAWCRVTMVFDTHPDTETWDLMRRYAEVVTFSGGTMEWQFYRKPGHPLLQRTVFWERKLLELQQLIS